MKSIIEFVRDDGFDLYWFDDQTNEREFIRTIKNIKMSITISDTIPSDKLAEVRRLGYDKKPSYCKVFKWFRKRWGYISWIEEATNKYIYKIYSKGVFYRPKDSTDYPHCETYEEAEVKLLDELITIIKEIEQ